MKYVTRVLLFSGVSLYLTSLWNKGFTLPSEVLPFFALVIFLAIITYLVVPVSKIVLFPLHLLTFGLMSVLFYIGFLYLSSRYLGLVAVKPWIFPGVTVFGITIEKVAVSYLANLVASSASLSVIINLLEKTT